MRYLHSVHSRRSTTFFVVLAYITGLGNAMKQNQTNLLAENGLGLTTETLLLSVVTALTCTAHSVLCAARSNARRTLGEEGGLASLVLGHLVVSVLKALLAGTERAARLRNVHLESRCQPLRRHKGWMPDGFIRGMDASTRLIQHTT